jgi:cation diffusion facilitator CzcD-associated flavoprotein CzcO
MAAQVETDLAAEAKLKVSSSTKGREIDSVLICVKIIVVGAGLGGVGAAISCLLAGHSVHILESTNEIGEVIISPDHFSCIINKNRSEPVFKSSPTPPKCSNTGVWKELFHPTPQIQNAQT